jgi:enamine deaminase RidA (YjgF/YER057c/UK114 family)
MHWTKKARCVSLRRMTDRDEKETNRFTRRDAMAGSVVAAGVFASGLASADPQAGERSIMEMEIRRIGITEPAAGIPIISFATVHAGIVCLCGVTADPNRLGDVKDQTAQILGRIDLLLGRAGTDKSKLLTAQVWLTDMRLFEDHNAAWNAWVDPKNPPARACLQSPALWRPGMLVEIMVTAVAA